VNLGSLITFLPGRFGTARVPPRGGGPRGDRVAKEAVAPVIVYQQADCLAAREETE